MSMRPGIPLRFRLAEEMRQQADLSSQGPLNLTALMFRRIKGDLNVNSVLWSSRMNLYLKDSRNDIVQTSRGRSSERSNLTRGLTRSEMTFTNFIKGLRVLRPMHLKFIFLLEHKNGSHSVHVEEMTEEDLYTHYHNERYPGRYNVLSKLFKNMRDTLIVNEDDWNTKFKNYLDDPVNGFSGTKRGSERGNLNRGLGNPNMSIKNFTKGLKVIDPARIYFTLELTFMKDQTTIHEVVMDGNHLHVQGDDDPEE